MSIVKQMLDAGQAEIERSLRRDRLDPDTLHPCAECDRGHLAEDMRRTDGGWCCVWCAGRDALEARFGPSAVEDLGVTDIAVLIGRPTR